MTREAKSQLWNALRFLRRREYDKAKQCIENALLFLEIDKSLIDPGANIK